jgi:hypothetical protein
VDQGSGQVLDPELAVGSAGRRKSGAYTVVCEHFEPRYIGTIPPWGLRRIFEIRSNNL